MYTSEQFKTDLDNPYAWPGGYPRYFVCGDGEALSFAAAKENAQLIIDAIRDEDKRSDWYVVGCDINWEDTELHCAHSGEKIESAYGED